MITGDQLIRRNAAAAVGRLRPLPKGGRRQAPPHAAGRRQDMQGLRAVAVLLVVAFHAHLPLPGGFVGIDMLFVISGFVVIKLWADALACTRTITRAEAPEQQRVPRAAQEPGPGRHAGSSTVDVTDDLCTATECTTTRDCHWLNRDKARPNVGGALSSIVGRFIDLIRADAVAAAGEPA